MIVGQPESFVWLWVVALAAALLIVMHLWRMVALRRYFAARPGHSLPMTTPGPRLIASSLHCAALALLVVALADVRWGQQVREVPLPRTQIVFVVDISRSMLARDEGAGESRLSAAKTLVREIMEGLPGERVGLVAFAGEARQLVPLTRTYEDVESALERLDTRGVEAGGSSPAAGILAAKESFLFKLSGDKVLILISDGEVLAEELPTTVSASQVSGLLWKHKAIRTVALGVGRAFQPSRIPIITESGETKFLSYRGTTVWTQQERAELQRVAAAGGGFYRSASRSAPAAVHRWMRDALTDRYAFEHVHAFKPRYHWFIAAALFLLFFPAFLGQVGLGRQQAFSLKRQLQTVRVIILLSIVSLAAGTSGATEQKREAMQRGNQAFAAGQFDQALQHYRRAAAQLPDRPEPLFNEAVTLLRLQQFADARRLFEQLLQAAQPDVQAKAHYNLGNCEYREVLAESFSRRQAITKLCEAMGHYRQALYLEPDWNDPRANLQLAYRLIRRLERQPPDSGGTANPSTSAREGGEGDAPPEQSRSAAAPPQRDQESSSELVGTSAGTENSSGQSSSGAPSPRSSATGYGAPVSARFLTRDEAERLLDEILDEQSETGKTTSPETRAVTNQKDW